MEEYDEFIRDSIINNSDYIFEGIVERRGIYQPEIIGYYGDDKTKICSAVKIKITKILRGHDDLKLGTAELIRLGGSIFDDSNQYIDGWANDVGIGLSDTHTQLFFCKKNEFPVKEDIFEEEMDNKQRLSLFYDKPNWDIIYKYSTKRGAIWMTKTFESINQLYRYLKKYDNIDIRKPEEKSFAERRALKKQQKDSIALQKEKGRLKTTTYIKA
ncbi:hypothetical protein [Aquimarina agarivorans]|uniref:hypothetical protein n=1 Tax=Aquimarina agarivorans TaxID=980584 RepID=UPI0003097FA7|nr:hypothetical protein [Aquimarina agarivorans]